MMTHHSVMTSSLRNKIINNAKFCYFSCGIDYNTKNDVFRDVTYIMINQCDPGALWRLVEASGGSWRIVAVSGAFWLVPWIA